MADRRDKEREREDDKHWREAGEREREQRAGELREAWRRRRPTKEEQDRNSWPKKGPPA